VRRNGPSPTCTFAETCQPIGLDEWRAAIAGRKPLPPRPVVVTFDDGYRSVFDVARPILQRYRIPAAMFICSEPVERRRLFWFDAVARQRGESGAYACRTLPYEQWRAAIDAAACSAAGDDPLAPMTIDQVRALAAEGFEIGVHTATHAPLGAAPPDAQRRELTSCRDALEQWTGRPVTALAYPWGKPQIDYTEETVRIAGDLGFDAAFATTPGFARPGQPTLERPRFLVLSEVMPAELAHRITYTWPR
jgi:peptidoglycan/xylan/chitin deacetylase (PgdA/CDA1 family)